MSRTTRKSRYLNHLEFEDICDYHGYIDKHSKGKFRAHIMNKWGHSLPKYFRKMVNTERRAKDKEILYKAINFDGYEEQCSKWNCKDNDAWRYW